ncbi:MAG TPA: cupin domain-containing protein [Albitalea sp.]|nr:cupin domain-containing protein [Albitalea sp.]
MNARHLQPVLAAGLLVLFSLPATAADAPADMAMVNPGAIKWGPAPAVLPKGAKVAVLMGDPGKAGPYVMRGMFPANYKVAPHTHTQAENITVLSGALYLGMGDKMDLKKGHAVQAGGFHHLPGKTPHYAYTKGPTVVQIHGEGPFDLNYLNPADNPDKSAKSAKTQ